MNQKSIRLSDDYRINNGIVEVFVRISEGEYDYENERQISEDEWGWKPSKYKVGAEVMLVSFDDVAPNALRDGNSKTRYGLKFNSPDGIGGNLNNDITRYHGWRGTTSDTSVYAHGLRKIVAINLLKNGTVSVTVGPDLKPDEE